MAAYGANVVDGVLAFEFGAKTEIPGKPSRAVCLRKPPLRDLFDGLQDM